MPGTLAPSGIAQAPTTTGPARGPRPASSTPMTKLLPSAKSTCSFERGRQGATSSERESSTAVVW
eukprot:5271734-Prorocentrum_lima.AAC.1